MSDSGVYITSISNKKVAKEHPLRIVFRNNGFKDDTVKENVKHLLKQLAPKTEMKLV